MNVYKANTTQLWMIRERLDERENEWKPFHHLITDQKESVSGVWRLQRLIGWSPPVIVMLMIDRVNSATCSSFSFESHWVIRLTHSNETRYNTAVFQLGFPLAGRVCLPACLSGSLYAFPQIYDMFLLYECLFLSKHCIVHQSYFRFIKTRPSSLPLLVRNKIDSCSCCCM